MKPRKVPMRKCVGCNQMFEKKSLLRIVRSNEGEVSVDVTGKKNGRGAYLCQNKQCLEQAFKKRAIERALEISLDDELKNLIRSQMPDE
ncbi:MAG: YlxR family protein [Tissierellia bacterium]|nr:YlxR family protein [Tissierellia bacterium]